MKRYIALILPFALTMSACKSIQDVSKTVEDFTGVGGKGQAGTAGGAAGVALGYAACRDKSSRDRNMCMVGGALVGALVGRELYEALKEEDRPRMAEETNKALTESTPQTAPRVWTNPDTGLKASVAVKEVSSQQVSVPVKVLKGAVKTPPPLEYIGQVYAVSSASTNVRGGPGTDYEKIGSPLPRNARIDVLGRVQSNPDWLFYSSNGVGSGYVYAANVKPTGTQISAPPQGAAVADTDTVNVSMKQTCKTLEQVAEYPGKQPVKQSAHLCQKSDGTWEMT